MSTPQDFATPAQLDHVSVNISFRRDLPGNPVEYRFSGTSRKRSHPLWVWTMTDEDARNAAANVGGVLDSVSYYRPTSQDGFLRACVGGSAVDEDPTLFDPPA